MAIGAILSFGTATVITVVVIIVTESRSHVLISRLVIHGTSSMSTHVRIVIKTLTATITILTLPHVVLSFPSYFWSHESPFSLFFEWYF